MTDARQMYTNVTFVLWYEFLINEHVSNKYASILGTTHNKLQIIVRVCI